MKQQHRAWPALAAGIVALGGMLSCSRSQAETRAYWRFDGGKAATAIPIGEASVPDTSGQKAALAVANADVQPAFAADVPLASVPRTGQKNEASAEFDGEDDLFTRDPKLNDFNFGPGGSNAWTVEFSLRLRDAEGVKRPFGRDGNTGEETRGPLQFVTVGDGEGETFDIRVEMLDGTSTFRDVASPRAYRIGRWYNVAATADSKTLSLYVDQLDGKGYQLVGTKPIEGAANATKGAFTLGRGWNGNPADRITGRLDEVRISDTVLPPAQFLFSGANGQGVVGPAPVPDPRPEPLKFPLFYAADPHVSFFEGQYWMYTTGEDFGRGNPSFFAFSSPDRKNWTKRGPVLQFKDVSWIYEDGERNKGPWAPGVATKNGKYYFYFSVGPQGRTPSRIGVAVGDSPTGPFKDRGTALLTGGNGFEAIDAMVFNDAKSGKSYFYAGGSAGAKLRVFELNPDMVSFAREIPVETPPQFTEGAWMHERNGIYYLSYSHGYWRGSSYSVHYATSATPYGPWNYRGRILESDATRKGPGHHSFVQDPRTGQWFIFYHRWQHPTGGRPLQARARSIAIEPIQFRPDGSIAPITMTDEGIPQLKQDQTAPLPAAKVFTPRPPVRRNVVRKPTPVRPSPALRARN